jgi:DNA helicase HerA-like ATPase
MVYFVTVIGMTGTGKTTYIKSQINKFLKNSKIKCLILDIEGDFSEYKKSKLNNLKEDFKKTNILRIQGTEDTEEQTKIYDYIFKHMRNVVVVIDEINSQGGREGRLNSSLERLAVRGRKRGIKLIFAGQRASLISKTLLSSSIVHVLKKQGWDNDYKIYRQLNKDVEQKIRESPNQYCTAVLKQGVLVEILNDM